MKIAAFEEHVSLWRLGINCRNAFELEPVNFGWTLGNAIHHVMNEATSDHWKYEIVTSYTLIDHVDIERLANTGIYRQWNSTHGVEEPEPSHA